AMLGIFSSGPLSAATAGTLDDGIEVDYQRFIRNTGRASLEIQVNPAQIENGKIELWITTSYLSSTANTDLEPDPDAIRIDGDRQIFTFPATSVTTPVRIGISFQPETIGRLPVKIGIVDGPSVEFTQFCYP